MTRYLLDTCTISDLFSGQVDTGKKLKKTPPSQVRISAVSTMEIFYGFDLNEAARRKFARPFADLCSIIQIVPFDQNAAQVAGKIRADLRKNGTPIGPWDLLIAATAAVNDLTLVTSNTREFERIADLKLDCWR